MIQLTGIRRARGASKRAAAAVPLVIALVLFCAAGLCSLGCRSNGDSPPQEASDDVRDRPLSGQNVLSVSYIDVGQGDAELIQTPGGKNILIDTGAAEGREALLNYLEQRGVRQLDLVIATHPHLDHVGNLPQVIRAYPVGEFMDSGLVTGSPAQERYLEALKEKRVKFTIVSRRGAETTRDLGDGITLRILQPRAPLLSGTDSDPNNNSIVALVTAGRVRFLFTGDMEEDEREQRLFPDGDDIRADIYKVAHHGSRNGTDDAFMEQVQPREAVISCGVRNDYGHPHPETMAALDRARARVWRTDEQGTIVVTTDGDGYQVTPLGKSADAPEPGNGPIHERRSRRKRSTGRRESERRRTRDERRTDSEQRRTGTGQR